MDRAQQTGMKRFLRDTAGKTGFEYLLIVAAIGTLGAAPFWAFGSGMDLAIAGEAESSALPTLGSASMAHTANEVDGMCYVQTFADTGSNAEQNATRHAVQIKQSGIDDAYVTQNQNGYYVTRIRVSCDKADQTLKQYTGMGMTSDAFIGNLPKSDDALFGNNTPAPQDPTPQPQENNNNAGSNGNAGSNNTSTPTTDNNGNNAGEPVDSQVGANAQAGEALTARDVSNNPMQLAINEVLALSNEELESLLAMESTTPTMDALLASYYEAVPEECFGESGLTEECASNPEVVGVLSAADELYYSLLSEAANELTYREFGSMSDEQLAQSIEDYQVVLEECTAMSPAPAYTEEGYPAVNESCQNESGEQFYNDYLAAVGPAMEAQDQEAYFQAEAQFAQSDIAAQCWAVQDQPNYDENGMMVATEACAGNQTKLNAFQEAQMNMEAVMYTMERRSFEDMFGADAYEGAHSLQLLEYDENGNLVRSERLYKHAEEIGLLEPGTFDAAVAADRASIEELEALEGEAAAGEGDDGEGGGGLFGWIGNVANGIGDFFKINEGWDWVASLGDGIPVLDQVTDVLAGVGRLATSLSPVGWLLEPADSFNFLKNTVIGVGKEFWDMGTGLIFGLVGDIGYNWLIKGGIMNGGIIGLDGGEFYKDAGGFLYGFVRPDGDNFLWNLGKNVLGTAYTAIDGSKSIDEQGQALGRTAAFVGTVWIGGASAATKLGKLSRVGNTVSTNAKVVALADDAARASGYSARAAGLQNRLATRLAATTDDAARASLYTQWQRAGQLSKSFQGRADAFSKANFATARTGEAATALGRTRLGAAVGERMAGPIQALYASPFGAPGRAWSRFANGLSTTANPIARYTGTQTAFNGARRAAAKVAGAPQWGIPFRHPYAMGAGGLVYDTGARSDDANYYIGAARDMMKAMNEGQMPGGGRHAAAPTE